MQNKEIQRNGNNSVSILPPKLNVFFNSTEIELIKHINSLTPSKAFGGQMSNFVKQNRPQLIRSIEKLLALLAVSVNVGKNLQPEQLLPLAEEIYSNYYFFSLDEIALCLRNGKQGKYGKLYDRLDGMIVLEWLKMFDEEREAYVINARDMQNSEYEKDSVNVIFEKFGQDAVKKVIEKMKEEDEDEKSNEENYNTFRNKYFKKDGDKA